MLQSIGDFLQGIWDFLSLIINFIIGLIDDIVYFGKLIRSLAYMIPRVYTWIPIPISICIGVCISLFLLLRIIGRD